ncbi:3-deoxy-manno-octulosonate cytidylyltransferase [Polaribacter sp. Q13]|uniref:3-deoxy-manno-octulosonate cytidylyltransferase n=1 Tax=Polaribacter sp. Q13 TaxID=2806551 RepID=UPI00193B4472|nr:3-deoxy-manno-octulosonate cytidylyltransferase [Polaribacter sp. Q13]QVY67333.1 3-deoxy-manno-octulosonate cytidylyltransferase [Polaribacter sp. Q13]
MRIVGVIPARYKSSRFPGKPLIRLNGIPMIIRVAQIVEKALGRENTYVATDDLQIKNLVESFGFNVTMTSEDCLTGTDRVYDFSKKVDADIYVNIQGDEPLLDFNEIVKIANVKKNNFDFVINGMCGFTDKEDPNNVNIPKVIVNKSNKLIYMSRLPVPGSKTVDSADAKDFKKQVCIYAFNKKELRVFGEQTEKSEIEKHEDIEILRFFDLNIPILMVETKESSLAVDVIEDVAKVEEVLKKVEN